MFTLPVRTSVRQEMVDITAEIEARIPPGHSGICHLFCRHTTAGLTINENADPDVCSDILKFLARMVPHDNAFFRHGEGNSDAHIKALLTGFSLTVPVTSGKFSLGTWQGIYFCEFDGPRSRSVDVRFL